MDLAMAGDLRGRKRCTSNPRRAGERVLDRTHGRRRHLHYTCVHLVLVLSVSRLDCGLGLDGAYDPAGCLGPGPGSQVTHKVSTRHG